MADYSSSGGGKIRSRRAAPSRKPYSRASSQRKSLFSRVTDSFRTLLNPITPKWLQNRLSHEKAADSPQKQGDRQDAIDADQPSTSSNHQDAYNRTNNNYKNSSPLARPPLATKSVASVSTTSLQYFVTPPDTPPVEVDPRDAPAGGGGGKQDLLKHLTMSSKRAKREMEESPVGSDSSYLRQEMKLLSANDNASVASSSGCSSSMQAGHRTNTSAENEGSQKPFWSSSMESLASSKASSSHQQVTMSSHKRPRFNPAIFGMQSTRNDTDRRHSSFYNGPVQFGGANASGRSPYFATPYKIPSVTKVKVRHVNHQRTSAHSSFTSSRGSSKSPSEETSAVGMSSTAKKILQTLEKMSTPLNDARKIPMTRTPSSYMTDRQKRRTVGSSSLLSNTLQAPPTVGLSSPSTAKLRRRSHMPLNNSLLVRKAKERREEESSAEPGPSSITVPDSKLISARGLPAPIASMSSSASLSKSKNNVSFGSETAGGKMKSQRRSAPHYSAIHDQIEEEAPELPNVALPLTSNLPSFNFGKSLMTSTPTVRGMEKKKFTGSKQPEFSFASPLVKTTSTDQAQSSSTTPKFQFTSPPNKGTSVSDDQETPKTSSSDSNFTSGSRTRNSPLMYAPDPKIISEVKKNKRISSPLAAPENQGGFRSAESLKKGGVMDILGSKSSDAIAKTKDTSKPSTKETNLAPLTQTNTGWDCTVCMLQNDNDALNCVACSAPKPSFSSIKPLSKSLKTSDNGWECGTCLLQNDAGAVTCVACEAPCPGSNQTPVVKKLGGGLLDTMKLQPNAGFSFGIPAKKDVKSNDKDEGKSEKPENSFGLKFKPPTGSWNCTTCLVQNDSKSMNCDACKTPKPGSSASSSGKNGNFKLSAADKAPEFKFGIPSKSSTNEKSKSSGWGDSIKVPTSSTWECEACMVPNPEERKTCEACDSPKPGTKKEFAGVSFKFSAGSPGLYSFGIQNTKTATTETNTPAIEEKATTSSSDVLKSTSVTTIPATESTQKPTFKFGVPAPVDSSSTSVPAPAFGTQSKKTEPPNFTFGVKPNAQGQEKKEGKESAPATGLFGFSAQKKEEPKPETEKAPMFGSPKSAGFSFGNQSSATSAQTTQSSNSNTNPLLGGVTASQISSTSFGPNINQQKQFTNNSTGLSAFGSGFKTEPQALSKPEEQKSSTAPPAFSFGASKPAAGATFPFTGSSGMAKPSNETQSGSNAQFSFGAKPDQTKQTSNIFGSSQPAATTETQSGSNAQFSFGAKHDQTKQTSNLFGSSQPAATTENKPAQFTGFGIPAKEPAKPAFGGFNFSATNSSSAQSTGGVFGTQSVKPSPFGAAPSEPSPFGNTTSTAPAFGAPSASSGGVFGAGSTPAFGAGSSNTTTPAFGGMTSSTTPAFGVAAPSETSTGIPKPSFAFGSNSNIETSQQKAPAFQFGPGSSQQNSGATAPNVGFNFGAAPSKQTSAFNNANPGGGFQFGTPTASNGLFQFGAGSNQPKSEQVGENKSGPFPFGGSTNGGSTQPQPPSTGFNFGGAPNTPGGFAFSGSQPAMPQGGFGGANGSAPNVNPFNATPASNPAQRGRLVRTARRRLRK